MKEVMEVQYLVKGLDMGCALEPGCPELKTMMDHPTTATTIRVGLIVSSLSGCCDTGRWVQACQFREAYCGWNRISRASRRYDHGIHITTGGCVVAEFQNKLTCLPSLCFG